MTMRKLVDGMMEKAGLPIEVHGDIPSMFDVVVEELMRANKLLDAHKDETVFSILNLTSAEDMIRATRAYTRSYLLGQMLSLASVQEVCQELIALAKQYKISPPQCWTDIAVGTFRLEEFDTDLESNDMEERYRTDM